MAPKAADKKPAQPAKKTVAKKSSGRKNLKGSKKAVESYKIYIYKVQTVLLFNIRLNDVRYLMLSLCGKRCDQVHISLSFLLNHRNKLVLFQHHQYL